MTAPSALPLRLREVDRVADLSPAAWDRLAGPGGFYLSHAWLRLLEEQPLVSARYVAAFVGERLVGALPLYCVESEPNPWYRPERYRDLLGVDGDYLLAGARSAYRNTLLLDPGLAPGRAAGVLEELVGAGLRTAASLGLAGLVLLFLTSGACATLARSAPLALALDEVEAEFPRCEGGIPGYLASLGHNRRRNVRRELAAFAEAGWELGEEDLHGCWRDVARLLANVQQRHGHRSSVRGLERLLERQAAVVGDRSVVFTCRDENGALAGAALMFRWSGVLYGRLVGFDYERLRGTFEYFNLAFYRPLHYCSRHGLTTLHLGIESREAKALRGATMRPLWSAVVPVGAPLGEGRATVRRAELVHRQRNELRAYSDARLPDDWALPDLLSQG